MNNLKYLTLIFCLITMIASCSNKPAAKQVFAFKLSAYTAGLEMAGGTFVRAVSSSSNKIVKLDANNSAEFPQGIWEFQAVRFQGPTPFGGKRYCGKIQNINLSAINQDVIININENNCLSEPFLSLITEISNEFDPSPIVVTAITPNTGNMNGGTSVTITGKGFFSGATVTLGGALCTSVVVTAPTSLTCTSSAHNLGSVIAVVINADTKSGHLPSAFNYVDMNGPDLSGISFNDGISEWSPSKTPTFNWNPAIDNASGIQFYEISLGTSPGATDVQNWTNIGNVTSYQANGLSLTRGLQYYASIRATDNSQNSSTAVSGDGWFVTNEMWVSDGIVKASAISGTTMYLGGTFSKIAEWSGAGVPLSLSTGLLNWPNPLSRARVSGNIEVAISDGQGGYYIGGSFFEVSGIKRNNLAHILADGSVSSWNPNMNSTVNTMAISGGNLYVGGSFYIVNESVSRNHLAAIDLATGIVTSWNPNISINNQVLTLAINGSTLYAGGFLTTVNGSIPRNGIAAFDLTTGNVTSWDPNISTGYVKTLAINGNSLYAGGSFTYAAGVPRNRLVEIDLSTGLATTWNPNMNGLVNAIAINGGTLYAGGTFTTGGGQSRNKLVALDLASGLATGWNPMIDGDVNALAVDGSTIYAGGNFTISGTRNRLAAFDMATGTATSWNPNIGGVVKTICLNGSTIYAGGAFTSANSSTIRNKLAAIDLSTGNLTSWNPNINGDIYALIINNGTMYIGGSFTIAAGQTRNNLAAIDISTGTTTAWNPGLNGAANTLAIKDNILYAGGSFTTAGGQTRNKLVALDLTINTANATSWNPDIIGGDVNTISIGSNTLYAGGTFTTSGGETRNKISAIDLATGTTTSWNPNLNYPVLTSSISGNNLYIGGNFTTVGADTRNRLAAIDLNTGFATNWNPNMDGSVQSLIIKGNTLYASGGFWTVYNGSAKRTHIAAIDLMSGAATNWNPNNVINIPYSLVASDSAVFAGGVPYEINTGAWLPGF